jgi:hypothetical protein
MHREKREYTRGSAVSSGLATASRVVRGPAHLYLDDLGTGGQRILVDAEARRREVGRQIPSLED